MSRTQTVAARKEVGGGLAEGGVAGFPCSCGLSHEWNCQLNAKANATNWTEDRHPPTFSNIILFPPPGLSSFLKKARGKANRKSKARASRSRLQFQLNLIEILP